MNTSPTTAAVEAILATVADPESGRPLTATGQVVSVAADATAIAVAVGLTSHSAILWSATRARIEELVRTAFPQVANVSVEVVPHDRPPLKLGQIGLQAKSVIAVGSGKGGVGKSTIATSIAIGLARAGSRTGLLDADVYGPSVPHLLGLSGRPQIEDGKIVPMTLDVGGISMPVMSMGFLVPPGEAVVWRGPMLHGAITQMLRDTRWGPLDYLVIDMPPGTGDIALTLSQALPLSGAVVVCTPQEVALLDATKAIAMFRKVNIPVLGLIENMSGEIFGRGGAKAKAEELGVPFLGEVPIDATLRVNGDAGQIASNFAEGCPSHAALQHVCERVAIQIAKEVIGRPKLPSLEIL